jgi:phosphatidylethanolamine-binding protein (PEBP) family uncharacterized protein
MGMLFKTVIAGVVLAALSGCGGGGGGDTGAGIAGGNGGTPIAANTFTLSTAAFTSGASIPNAYRCVNRGGSGNLPPLSWTNLPNGTKALVVIMDDEDGLGLLGQRVTFTHYFALIPYQSQVNAISSIDQVANPVLPYEQVWTTAASNWIVLSDLQPCNPESAAHTYRWTVYALNTEYDSIADMKNFFDAVINNAIGSNTTIFNLNRTNGPTLTRQGFESQFGSYIIDKATLEGVM